MKTVSSCPKCQYTRFTYKEHGFICGNCRKFFHEDSYVMKTDNRLTHVDLQRCIWCASIISVHAKKHTLVMKDGETKTERFACFEPPCLGNFLMDKKASKAYEGVL